MQVSTAFESLRESEQGNNFYLSECDAILSTDSVTEIRGLLVEIERVTASGYYAFGFVTYEAGYAFLPGMPVAHRDNLPLAWFALTKNPGRHPFEKKEVGHQVQNLELSQSLAEYSNALSQIRRHIERGDTYQVNYTLRYRGNFAGSTNSLYEELKQKQRVSYAAKIETPDWCVISLSPELFFRRQGEFIEMRPMKGTAARGRTTKEDQLHAQELQESLKERAENLMIVDMLRNDLGKICRTGSVEVTRAFEVERYETLLQMTSTITGELRKNAGLSSIFEATFPSGSITGAPKIRTMQIIHELEQESRGIYTGAIGYAHGDDAVFSVAIRTALIDRVTNRLELGVGSGVLHEADSEREYRECQLKGNFLTVPQIEFELIETMLWIPGEGFRNLSYHFDRLSDSADYFLFHFDPGALKKKLQEEESRLKEHRRPARVRVLLHRTGEVKMEIADVEPIGELPARIGFASSPVDSSNRFLFHKTTNRPLYDLEYQSVRQKGFFDVLFMNEREEITEGAISNIFIKRGSKLYTPPISSGLLAGIFRRQILENHSSAEERVLKKDDVLQADEIFVTNAIRGMIPAVLQPQRR